MIERVQTDVLEIAYETYGAADAPPVVLVHGFPDDVRTWDAVTPALTAAGYRVLVPYLRGFGPTRFRHNDTPRSGQLAALGQDLIDLLDALALEQVILVGHDWGARAAYIAAALRPQRLRALLTLAVGYGTNQPTQTLSYAQTHAYWYQWFFHTPQGAQALETDRRNLCRMLWQTWSPGWRFDDEAFTATAQSWDNPDFVAVALSSYCHRWGNAPGDGRYDALEKQLATPPMISVPTTLLHGADDGATLPETSAGKESLFSGGYERQVIPGVGHFIQREQPEAVIAAVLAQQ